MQASKHETYQLEVGRKVAGCEVLHAKCEHLSWLPCGRGVRFRQGDEMHIMERSAWTSGRHMHCLQTHDN